MARFHSKEPAWGVDPSPVSVQKTAKINPRPSADALLHHAEMARQKTAAFPPPTDGGGGDFPDDGGGAGGKRNIPKDHPYDPKSLKPLAKALWAASVGMGHALTSYRFISRIKSSTISPDGMIGGRGYVMNVNDIRKKLHEACESLSTITDSLYDEINAPHWKPRLAELDENDAEDVERFVEESKAILENPEADAEEEAKEIEEENDGDDEASDSKGSASEVPGGKDLAPSMAEKSDKATPHPAQTKQAQRLALRIKKANSSLPVETMPGGPRIEHLDREDADPNPQDAYTNDDWGLPSGKEYDYPSAWDNNLNENQASLTLGQSSVPDSSSDLTPTDGWDFGLGFGARGEGAGGYENPSGEGDGTKGVWGPSSGLPGTPAGSSGDTTPALDSATSNHEASWKAAAFLTKDEVRAFGLLPNDTDRPVARSDYFPGDRGNLVNTQLSQSEVPGSPSPSGEASPGLMNTDYVTEDVSTPYVRYDYTTHDYRDDPLHNWPQRHLTGTNDDV